MSRFEIPGFEILERIGSGGMAVVWKARQISLDRTVAIKVLSAHLSRDSEDIEQFKSEAQAEAKLKHSGIVQVYDANVESGLCYIVQEYVDGYSVGEWVRRKGHLPEEDALLVADYVADALAYAWETAGVIHCDIKPDNILIDADGTPKVTDLGLARTISAMTDDAVSNEVMGTPAYMSPEQIQGLPDLDCRTDIYSLGATLYHCVTGKMLFQGDADETVMDRQLREVAEAPSGLNPELSPWVCGLIEKLLAKNRDHRYADWAEVRADIRRVKRGLPPAAPLVKPGLSTVPHVPMPPSAGLRAADGAPPARGRKRIGLVSVLAALASVALGVLIVVWGYGALVERVDRKEEAGEPFAASGEPPGAVEANAPERLLQEALSWHEAHPDDYRGAEQRYRRVMIQAAGTPMARIASDELQALRADRKVAARNILQDLEQQATTLAGEGGWLAAAEVYAGYDGPLSAETAEERTQRAEALKGRHEAEMHRERMAEVEQRQHIETVLGHVAHLILAEGLSSAQRVLRAEVEENPDSGQAESLVALERMLADAGDTDAEVIESFEAQVGEIVDVSMKTGSRKVKIVGVVDGVAYGRLITDMDGVSVELQIRPEDLTAGERLARMGSDEDPDVALAKGLMAWKAGAMVYARDFFARTDPLLADRLVALVDERATTNEDAQAKAALLRLLRGMGLLLDKAYSRDVALVELRSARLGDGESERVIASLDRFREQFGGSLFARENADVLDAVRSAVGGAVAEARRRGTGIGAMEHLTAEVLRDALVAANPGLVHQEVVVEEAGAGRIVRVEITSSHARDLAPLGACADLAALRLSCPGLHDLSGLGGVPLTSLSILESDVRDLSPLRQMPLVELRIENSPVRDLMALNGKAITSLSLVDTRVGDLRSVSGMPLESLDISRTPIKRLDLLRDMPLAELKIADLRISRLSSLAGLPLRRLDAKNTMVRDLSFLKGSGIEYLDVAGTAVASLSGVAGSQLRWLDISRTRVRSLDGLDGLKLHYLDISDTSVSDLDPLRGLPLGSLSIDGTLVTDLGVLHSLPLKSLSCRNLVVKDYAALKGLRVESISIADAAAMRDVLETMPNLVEVNGFRIRPSKGGDVEAPAWQGRQLPNANRALNDRMP